MSALSNHVASLFGVEPCSQSTKMLESSARLVKAPAGARLFASGDTVENFIIVASGGAKVQLSTRSGRNITLFRLGPGQCCALTTSCLLSSTPYYAEGIAETDLEIISIPSVSLKAALSASPDLMRVLLSDLAARIAGLATLIDRHLARDLNSDLAELLLGAENEMGRVELSHKQIAEELGTAREVVSRKLKDLERAGAIRIGRGHLALLRRDKLEQTQASS